MLWVSGWVDACVQHFVILNVQSLSQRSMTFRCRGESLIFALHFRYVQSRLLRWPRVYDQVVTEFKSVRFLCFFKMFTGYCKRPKLTFMHPAVQLWFFQCTSKHFHRLRIYTVALDTVYMGGNAGKGRWPQLLDPFQMGKGVGLQKADLWTIPLIR